MVPTLEKKISSPSTVIKIVAGVHAEKNVEYFDENSRELEKTSHEYKESSSTQTSSSSSLLHKRKVHSYYVTNRTYKPPPPGSYFSAFWKRPERNQSALPQRIISAKFLKVKQLQNELTEAQQKITDLLEENRTLKNIHKRQDTALKKYECQDSCLPQLIRSHEEELRVITSKFKKLKNTHLDLEARYNKQHAEMVAVKERHKHLLQISKDKHLFQREHLTKQIEEMKIQINEFKNKIQLQARRLDLEAKSYKHQLAMELGKQKVLQDQVKNLQETIDQLQSDLKDKEKFIVNSKVSHLIANKSNRAKSKLPPNPLKSLRICSTHEDDKLVQLNTNDIRKENETNEISGIGEMVGETIRISSEKEKVNSLRRCNKASNSIVSTRESRVEDYLHELEDNGNGMTRVQKKAETKSDSNNNVRVKRNSLDSNLSDSQTKVTYDEEEIRNYYSENSFELNDTSKTTNDDDDDETSSEKSDEELKSLPDDTISWLEFHERMKRANDDIDSKLDDFCDTFASRELQGSTSWQSKFQVQLVSKTSKNNQKTIINERGLSKENKSALLSALSQIDEEKNDSNPFHAIFESVNKKSSSVRTLDKTTSKS